MIWFFLHNIKNKNKEICELKKLKIPAETTIIGVLDYIMDNFLKL